MRNVRRTSQGMVLFLEKFFMLFCNILFNKEKTMKTRSQQAMLSQLLKRMTLLGMITVFALFLFATISSPSAHAASFDAALCSQGFVWRDAKEGDGVCVTPQTRAQAKYDNSQAESRREPNGGPYGPDTCKQGYVWREAFENDHVCVTPQTRSLTASDNLREQLLALINQDRAAQNLPAYIETVPLANAAYKHSVTMTGTCQLKHVCPGEPTSDQRLRNEGVQFNYWGENIGDSSPQPDAWGGLQTIERNMLAEQAPNDGHRKNLLSTTFTTVGLGVVIDDNGYVWVTEDFVN